MICEKIKLLRERAGLSQTQLAKKLDVTRSSVNAWEMGLSMPTTQYVVELARLFHVSTDFILGVDSEDKLALDMFSPREKELLYQLISYFDEQRGSAQ